MTAWIKLDDRQLGITLQYPDPTPLGAHEELDRRQSRTSYRVHLASSPRLTDVDELYVEVGRHESASVDDVAQRFRSDVQSNLPEVTIQPESNACLPAVLASDAALRGPAKNAQS